MDCVVINRKQCLVLLDVWGPSLVALRGETAVSLDSNVEWNEFPTAAVFYFLDLFGREH